MEMERINVYLEKNQKIKLRTIASMNDWSMNELIKRLIQDMFLRAEESKEFAKAIGSEWNEKEYWQSLGDRY